MTKNEYGVWEITIPPTPEGECAIPHDSKLKVCTKRSFMPTPLKTITDLYDTTLWRAHRAHSSLDH